MATSKNNKQGKGAGNVDWRDPVRTGVAMGGANNDKEKSDVSIIIVICLAIMALTFVFAIPLLGMAYVDMNNATVAAAEEFKRMREVRRKYVLELRKLYESDDQPATPVTPEE